MMLSERLDLLAPALQEASASFPNLAGVILSPAALWAGKAPPDVPSARIERNGGIALPDVGSELFADWYEHEATRLDWALEQLGHLPFHTLVQDFPSESDH